MTKNYLLGLLVCLSMVTKKNINMVLNGLEFILMQAIEPEQEIYTWLLAENGSPLICTECPVTLG